MYTSIDNSILSELSAMQIATYITIKKFMSFTSYKSRVGIRKIASNLGISKNTARKYVIQLAEKGIVLRKINFNKVKQEYDTTEYFFIKEMEASNKSVGVGQNSNKSGSTVGTKLSLKEVKRGVKADLDINLIKKELLKDYNDKTITQALKILTKAIRRGTVIDNIERYIDKLCTNIKAQEKLIENIKVDDKDITENKHKKSPSSPQTRASNKYNNKSNNYKTKFHNFEQRTSRYTPEELERMVLRKK